MIGFGLAIALVEAVRHRAHADVVTFLALLNRCLHIELSLSFCRANID